MAQLKVPFLNPIHYTIKDYENPDQYNTKYFDDFGFEDTIKDFEQFVNYYQPWQTSDSIHQQLISNYAPLTLKVIRESDGAILFSDPFVQVFPNFYDPGLYIYEHTLNLNILPEGVYRLQIEAGSPATLTLISNPLLVCDRIEESVLLEYKHYEPYGEVIFPTGFNPSFRMYGYCKFDKPAAKRTVYEDQPLNKEVLKTIPYRLYKLFSRSEGFPDYLVDLLNRALGCSDLVVDGKSMSADGDLEKKEEEGYPMSGWAIALREKLNRSVRIYENGSPVNARHSVVVSVDNKGFGGTGGTTYGVIDIE
jgi:hypothetical protein